jgi:hypothetical protein
MVLNATFSNISLYRGDQFYWWRRPEYSLASVNVIFSGIMAKDI